MRAMRRQLSSKIKYFVYKCYVLLKERKTIISDVPLQYLFYPNKKSNVLLIAFSACAEKPQYNYVKTLKTIKANKLFIKDNFSDNKRGCYYLNGSDLNVEDATILLIEKMVKKTKSKSLVFVGSSKGGYSALNIGIHFSEANIVIGAPQYLLGNYLHDSKMYSQMNFLYSGDNGFKDRDALNEYLRNKIKLMHSNIKKLYIHYSDSEHTYSEHIVYLLRDLELYNVNVVQDVLHYTQHGDVAFYYPSFLRRIVENIL